MYRKYLALALLLTSFTVHSSLVTADLPLSKSSPGNEQMPSTSTTSKQGFTIDLLNDYELSEEETGKDIIFSTKTPYTWMRIEVLPVQKNADSMLLSETKQRFEEQFGQAKLISTQPPNLKTPVIAGYETHTKTEKVTTYLMRQTNQHLILKVTMITAIDSQDQAQLISMINSIHMNGSISPSIKDNGTSKETIEQNQKMRLPEQKFTYQNEGVTEEKMGFLQTSKNQNYTLYVLEGYEFTEEEPRKDVIYYKDNDQLWMRIEILPKDTKWPELKSQTKEMLKAGFNTVSEADSSTLSSKLNIDASFIASNNKMKGQSLLIKAIENRPAMRLTIFTPKETEGLDAFLEMANTIETL
ncbi:hypothetical protein FZC66_10895 [Priestia megaterium]|nr:hypothetical protein FZC66_10895 [Priestia megaterium]